MPTLDTKTSTDFEEDMYELQDQGTHTITRYVSKFRNKSGTCFYKKADPNGTEFKKYALISKYGVPIPQTVLYLKDTQEIVTQDSGIPLQDKMRADNLFYYNSNAKVAKLVREMHSSFTKVSTNTHSDLLPFNPGHTSHPILNFESRFIGENSNASNAFLNSNSQDLNNLDLPGDNKKAFIDLYFYVLSTMTSYLNSIKPMIEDCYGDKEMILGDFKPENLLYDIQKGITVIDPSCIKGSKYFDVTKYVSRLLLEGVNPNDAIRFIGLYEGHIDLDKVVYRGLTMRALINIDMINILSSYIGRYLQGKTDYRLVNQLCKVPNVPLQWKKALEENKNPTQFLF